MIIPTRLIGKRLLVTLGAVAIAFCFVVWTRSQQEQYSPSISPVTSTEAPPLTVEEPEAEDKAYHDDAAHSVAEDSANSDVAPEVRSFWVKFDELLQHSKPQVVLAENKKVAKTRLFEKHGHNSESATVGDYVELPDVDFWALRDAHMHFVQQARDLATYIPFKNGTRGIVIMASPELMPIVVVQLRFLRSTGSKLPVEVFLETQEDYEPAICEEVFATLDTKCIVLENIFRAVPAKLGWDLRQLKGLVPLLSEFDEILVLDADTVPVVDPADMMGAEPFRSLGLITWSEIWSSTTSPKFYDIASCPQSVVGSLASSSSAQLLVSKSQHSATLLLAAYYNYNGPSHFYQLLSQASPASAGKETYTAASQVLNMSHYIVDAPESQLGYLEDHVPVANPNVKTNVTVSTTDHKGDFKSSALIQHDPTKDFLSKAPAIIQNSSFTITHDSTSAHKNVTEQITQTSIRPAFIHASIVKLDAATLSGQWNEEINGRMWGDVQKIKELFGWDVEMGMWAEVLYTGCSLENKFRAWTNKTDVCADIRRLYDRLTGGLATGF